MFQLSWRMRLLSSPLLLSRICFLVGYSHAEAFPTLPYVTVGNTFIWLWSWPRDLVVCDSCRLAEQSWSSISFSSPSILFFSLVASILLLVSESRLDCRESIAHCCFFLISEKHSGGKHHIFKLRKITCYVCNSLVGCGNKTLKNLIINKIRLKGLYIL